MQSTKDKNSVSLLSKLENNLKTSLKPNNRNTETGEEGEEVEKGPLRKEERLYSRENPGNRDCRQLLLTQNNILLNKILEKSKAQESKSLQYHQPESPEETDMKMTNQ